MSLVGGLTSELWFEGPWVRHKSDRVRPSNNSLLVPPPTRLTIVEDFYILMRNLVRYFSIPATSINRWAISLTVSSHSFHFSLRRPQLFQIYISSLGSNAVSRINNRIQRPPVFGPFGRRTVEPHVLTLARNVFTGDKTTIFLKYHIILRLFKKKRQQPTRVDKTFLGMVCFFTEKQPIKRCGGKS